jgi:hypothetical protein
MVGSGGDRIGHRPLSRLRRQLPARRGAALRGGRLLALLSRPPPCGGQIREADQGVGLGLSHSPNVRSHRASHRPLSRLRRQLPARRGAARRAGRLLTLLSRPPPCGGQIREADQGVGLGLFLSSNLQGHRASHRPLSLLRRQLPARRGAAQWGASLTHSSKPSPPAVTPSAADPDRSC